jgi:hypothetical protein
MVPHDGHGQETKGFDEIAINARSSGGEQTSLGAQSSWGANRVEYRAGSE